MQRTNWKGVYNSPRHCKVIMDSSQHIVMYNGSCTLDISIFISLSQAPFAYHFLAIGNLVCSLTAITGNAIILLALRRCSSLHPSSKALLGLVALVFYYRKSTNSMFIVFFLPIFEYLSTFRIFFSCCHGHWLQ